VRLSDVNGESSFLSALPRGGKKEEKSTREKWKVLVVDDDQEVHVVTKLVLKGFQFEGREIDIASAYSAKEASAAITQNRDIALILLDVVMESDNAGLDFVRFVREKAGNRETRIILRTGHPGQAPEHEVIVGYDINDYKDKTELTSQKLRTAVVAALRSYRDLKVIDANRIGLRKIIESLASIFKFQSLRKLASGVLTQLSALLGMGADSVFVRSGMTIAREEERLKVVAATGDFERFEGEDEGVLPEPVARDIERVLAEKKTMRFQDRLVTYSRSERGSEEVIYLSGVPELGEMELSLVDIFALNASIAFDNNYLADELDATQKEVIYTLGEVAERRSKETGSHVKRVAAYSQLLARLYGLTEDEVMLLGYAAPTHDIGKIAIPDKILNKPAPLTDEEMAVMQTHTELGQAMLGKSTRTILKACASIARSHHEFWDGNGYPDQLKGEAIPLFGRIVAVADVYDALSHDRVYKAAWGEAEIVEFMRKRSGSQFEPRLIELFLAHLEDFKAIKSQLPD
jgi:response regulator RpfG family c-di-GMP phosphodiesterase